MMIGSYPCCNGDLWIPMPDKTPAYAPEDCPHCGKRVWHVFSRLAPETFTEAEFLTIYDVDSVAKTITPKSTKSKDQKG